MAELSEGELLCESTLFAGAAVTAGGIARSFWIRESRSTRSRSNSALLSIVPSRWVEVVEVVESNEPMGRNLNRMAGRLDGRELNCGLGLTRWESLS
jgi:hypothetical protein